MRMHSSATACMIIQFSPKSGVKFTSSIFGFHADGSVYKIVYEIFTRGKMLAHEMKTQMRRLS